MQLEILALRHQLAVYRRSVPRPRLQLTDRLLWSWLTCVWSRWQDALAFVQPCTVVSWQQKRFRVQDLVSLDFFVVPTVTYHVLFVYERRVA